MGVPAPLIPATGGKPEKPLTLPEQADLALARKLAPFRRSLAVRTVSAFASIGDQPPLLGFCLPLLAAGVLSGDRRLARAGTRMLLANSLAVLAKNFVKERIDRSRPGRFLSSGDYYLRRGQSDAHEDRSFPSGHSACATAVGLALAREYPDCAPVAKAMAAAVALGQIPRLTHYPTDVLAGCAIGFLAEWAVSKVLPAS